MKSVDVPKIKSAQHNMESDTHHNKFINMKNTLLPSGMYGFIAQPKTPKIRALSAVPLRNCHQLCRILAYQCQIYQPYLLNSQCHIPKTKLSATWPPLLPVGVLANLQSLRQSLAIVVFLILNIVSTSLLSSLIHDLGFHSNDGPLQIFVFCNAAGVVFALPPQK